MQWIAPKQKPTTSTMVSVMAKLLLLLSAQNFGTVFVTQVNITILATHNKETFCYQAIADCFQHRFPFGLRRFSCMMKFIPCLWIWFSECSNRPIDIERFVLPENLYHKIHGRIRKCHDFEMGDWEVFDGPCNALHHKPRRLQQDKWFSKPVTLPLVLDLKRPR